ncbi:excise [Mycobacterium phage Kalnoky]|uniref:Helix-turn-helix domain-containing protein n=1 Tax=Mycobacterium phage PurpleHaze TaxID=1983577 RepID=A0A220NRV9_9CAUD|nr:excisionase family DNA-binding protein [Mycobacterium phage Purple Haze]AVJ50781.1 HTH DNA binding protein [Mycobacterium phage OlanP]AXC35143.1 excise [Mycobacterium phage Phranny]AXH44084.1 excise [Mycobacterium phage Kalnoky]AXH44492.1 excise [Mycobacterium phage Marius]AXH44664.1 excise [Mycobacterium phage PhishRPhriends]AXH44814.1 excise [Mycobacterium phage Reba]AZF96806.1 excise [Mycobacterium Phage Kalb97]AZV00526.1 helix-turn-helix DNA binding domain protein [Mycobacterium phag
MELPLRASIQQVADHLGVSTKTVRRYIADGRLKAIRLGPRLIRVERSSVEELMRPIGNFA